MKQITRKFAIAFLLSMQLSGCSFREINSASTVQAESTTATTAVTTQNVPVTTEPAIEKIENPVVNIIAVGDDLVQTGVYRAAQNWSTDGTYDFTNSYANVKEIIQSGDISVINQETLIANDEYEISGSNFNFNSPTQLGYTLIDVGFDVFTLANNHLLDKTADGLRATLDYWDGRIAESGVTVVGAYRNEADRDTIRVREVNGMRVAFLSFTEMTNGYSLPSDSELEIIYTAETEVMEQQIRAAQEVADAVVVSVHWGWEDTHQVAPACKELAQQFVDWGADVILGTHSHTAETMEYLTRPDGTQGFVFYSLGNFISAQTDNFNVVGEIADFNLEFDLETEQVSVTDVQVIPVITHYDDGSFSNLRLYPYSMYTAELADSHGLPVAPLGTAKAFSMDVINRIIEENIPVEYRKLD